MSGSYIEEILNDTFLSLSQDDLPSLLHHLTATEYASLTEKQRSLIKTTQFIPPKIGSTHFGKFKISLKLPMTKQQFLNYTNSKRLKL